MYPTDGGGYDGDEPLDWLWDLEGYDVGAAGEPDPAGEATGVQPSPSGVKKHLRKHPVPHDEFATAAFTLNPPNEPIDVPERQPEFSAATVLSPAMSPMEAEVYQPSRRPLMVAAVLLIVGLAVGVGLAMSGGGKKHVAQPAQVVTSPNTTDTTTTTTITSTVVAADTTTLPPTTDTTVAPPPVAGSVTGAAPITPPTGTTIPVHRPGPTTPPGTTPRTAPPTTHPPTTTAPTTPAPTTVTTSVTTVPVTTTTKATAPPAP